MVSKAPEITQDLLPRIVCGALDEYGAYQETLLNFKTDAPKVLRSVPHPRI